MRVVNLIFCSVLMLAGGASILTAAPHHPQNTSEGTPAEKADLQECRRRLAVIGKGLAAYRRDHKRIPHSLDELYPRYVQDKSVFSCPAGKKEKEKGAYWWIFGNLYKTDGSPARGINSLQPTLGPVLDHIKTWRDVEIARMIHFGDSIPAILCTRHESQFNTRLALGPSGRVFEFCTWIEYDPERLACMLEQLGADLEAQPSTYQKRWAMGLADTFVRLAVQWGAGIPPQSFSPIVRTRITRAATRLANLVGNARPTDRPALIHLIVHSCAFAGAPPNGLHPLRRFTQGTETDLLNQADIWGASRQGSAGVKLLDARIAQPGTQLSAAVKRARLQIKMGQTDQALKALLAEIGKPRSAVIDRMAVDAYSMDTLVSLMVLESVAARKRSLETRVLLADWALLLADRLKSIIPPVNFDPWLGDLAGSIGDIAASRKWYFHFGNYGKAGWIAYNQGDYGEAQTLFLKGGNKFGLGCIANIRKDLDTAAKLCEEAANERTNVWKANPLALLASVRMAQGRLDEAEQIFQQVTLIREKGWPGTTAAADSHEDFAELALKRGNLSLAKQEVQAALDIYNRLGDKPSADAYFLLGSIADESGNSREAIAALKQAVALLDS